MSNLGDVFSLVRRWSRRDRRPWQSRRYDSVVRDTKWQENRNRHDFETAGALYSVKFLGVYAVDNPYDELGCGSALSKRGRKSNGHHHSSRVILSLTSTTIKIIHQHWVAFEHAVTAVSTCYTDQRRPRLFAYIVKNYTSGNHFCMAFKTLKTSGPTGEELQRVFGYAFDSCCSVSSPLLFSSEEEEEYSSLAGESELERCLQICHSSHQTMKSNSNFSAMLKMTVGNQFVTPTSYTLSHTSYTPRRSRRKCVATRRVDPLSIANVDDANSHIFETRQARSSSRFALHQLKSMHNRVEKQMNSMKYAVDAYKRKQSSACRNEEQDEEQEQEEMEEEDGPLATKPTLNRCFFCQHQTDANLPLDRSVSESYLQHKVLQHYHHLTPHTPCKTLTKTTARAEQEQFKVEASSTLVNFGAIVKEDPLLLLEDGAVSHNSVIDINDELKKKLSKSDNMIQSSVSDVDGTKEGNIADFLVVDLSHDSLEETGLIERQTAYFNLPAQDTATNQLLLLPTLSCNTTHNSGLSTTAASENLAQSVEDNVLNSESFVNDLTLKLNQLMNSLQHQSSAKQLQSPSKIHETVPPSGNGPSSNTPNHGIFHDDTMERICHITSPTPQAFLDPTAATSDSSAHNEVLNSVCDGNSPLTKGFSPTSSAKETSDDDESSSESQKQTSTTSANANGPQHSSTNSDESFMSINSSTTQNNITNNQTEPLKNVPPTNETASFCIPCNTPSKHSSSTTSSPKSTSNTNQGVRVSRLVAVEECGSNCSHCQLATHEARSQLSRVLALLSSPLLGSAGELSGAREGSEDSERKITNLTCLIATWEHSGDA